MATPLTASAAGAAAAPTEGDVACSVCSVADSSDGRLSAGCCLAGGLLLDAEAGEGTSGAGLSADAGGGVVLLSDGSGCEGRGGWVAVLGLGGDTGSAAAVAAVLATTGVG